MPVPTPSEVGVEGDGVVGSTPTCVARAASSCCQYANVVW
ncbi:hypothetical protein J2754_001440 [Halarchaeum solikamskense]|nr:hypothetical protein [Halarchaeum solikamskense]